MTDNLGESRRVHPYRSVRAKQEVSPPTELLFCNPEVSGNELLSSNGCDRPRSSPRSSEVMLEIDILSRSPHTGPFHTVRLVRM